MSAEGLSFIVASAPPWSSMWRSALCTDPHHGPAQRFGRPARTMEAPKSWWAIAFLHSLSSSNAARRTGFSGRRASTRGQNASPRRLKSEPTLPGFGLPRSILRPKSRLSRSVVEVGVTTGNHLKSAQLGVKVTAKTLKLGRQQNGIGLVDLLCRRPWERSAFPAITPTTRPWPRRSPGSAPTRVRGFTSAW